MEEAVDSEQNQTTEELSQRLENVNISPTFTIWPPSQRTRDAVISRLIQTLSTPSVLSKRYGTLDPEEASSTARSIEEEAFNSVAGSSADPDSVDGGIEILQTYSKEISRLMLEAVKSRASGATSVASSEKLPEDAPTSSAASVISEEVSSSADKESSN